MTRIAVAQYPLDPLACFADYETKITRWVEDAASGGAELLVFPEYGAMELAHLAGAEAARDIHRAIATMQDVLPEADGVLSALARKHGVTIIGGSAPVRQDDERYHNIARVFGPSGRSGAQPKRMMTRFEDEEWGVSAGDALSIFETPIGRIGIAICFDVEFPILVRALVEAGADMILAPSCTDTLAGYWRVRIGAQARALENQCIVVQAPLVGNADWCPAVDVNVGAAGVYGPPDRGFPDNGVLALGEMNAPGWVFADIDRDAIAQVRAEGAVFNHRSWPLQADLPRVRETSLL